MAKIQNENWLRTNEIEEFVGALEFSAEIICQVNSDITKWKWLILAIHNALQGACVCALRSADTTGISVLDEKCGRRMWHWLDVESRKDQHPPPPKEKLAPMLKLYTRAQDARYLSVPLPPNPDRDRDVERLNSLRNELIHFVPKGLSVELSGMPQIIRSCCNVIMYLILDHTSFAQHLRRAQAERISIALNSMLRATNA